MLYSLSMLLFGHNHTDEIVVVVGCGFFADCQAFATIALQVSADVPHGVRLIYAAGYVTMRIRLFK